MDSHSQMNRNVHAHTVESFGEEWSQFDQRSLNEDELREIFGAYFRLFPWNALPRDAVGFDLGCGSGRWDKFVAPRVARLHCIDASAKALDVARRNLREFRSCEFHCASVDDLPLTDGSMDFGFSLGVLHHVPDTSAAIRSCVAKLKAGAPFLVYLYYAFDNRPAWYRMLWGVSDLCRKIISRWPYRLKYLFSQATALFVYFPCARFSLLLERLGLSVDVFPLSAYRRRSFYTMRTDALDRLGTPLEKRFTAKEIQSMMESAGLDRIRFSDSLPYWCALGYKKC